ncbi:MAG: oligosaccharide flippase family protein, partial [Nanoarchaeota archaeon]
MNKETSLDRSLKILVKSSLLVFVGIFISKIMLYLYRVIIARHYGPETYGLFSLSVIILSLFAAFATLGLNEGILRYIPIFRSKKDLGKISYLIKFSLRTVFFLSLVFSLVLFFSSNFISEFFFHNISLSIFLKISSFTIPLLVLSSVYLASIRGFEKIGWYSFIVNILPNVTKFLAIVIFVYLGIKREYVMISYFLGILLMLLVSYYIYKTKISKSLGISQVKLESRYKLKKHLFIYSMPIMFSSILGLVYYWIDSFAIGFLKGVTDVGIYNVVVPIALLLTIIP